MSTASQRQGMGALPYPNGTTFRVWAPSASAVVVAGSFNGWSPAADPLTAEPGGYWSTDVPAARPGDEYEFVITTSAGQLLHRVDPYGQHMESSNGHSIVYDGGAFPWGDAEYHTPTWDDLVIYELHVGSFNSQGRAVGQLLQSVVDRLPYLAALGVSAIELLPPAEFAGNSSWGYNPSSIFTVESAYGGPDALKAFLRAAHRHGIAVLCDVVYNHFGNVDNAVWQFDGWQDPMHPGGIYVYDTARSTTPWGSNRADYGRPEVRQFLRDNALMWLEQYRFDGLRWDATNYIRNVGGNGDPALDLPDGLRTMSWINSEVDARQPWKITIAEDMQGRPEITERSGPSAAGFDSQWDAGFLHPVRDALRLDHDEDRSMTAVAGALTHMYGSDPLHRVIYTESHDEVAASNGKSRVPSEVDPGDPLSYFARKRSTLGAALVFTAPGIPMLFQGQELYEVRAWNDNVPLNWADETSNAGIVALYRDLIALRRNARGTTRGLRGSGLVVHHLNDRDKLIGFHRWSAGGPRDSVLVLMNFGNVGYPSYTFGVPAAGNWRVRMNTDWRGYDPLFGGQDSFDTVAQPEPRDGMDWSASIGIAPYTAVILSQD